MSRVQFIEQVPIRPVAVDRVKRLRNGRRVVITADVGMVAERLQEIDPRFHMSYDPGEALYVLELHTPEPDGSVSEHFVGAYDELDARIIERARMISQPGYDLAAEIERAEREAEREAERLRMEAVGEMAERLQFALRKDLGRHEIGSTLKSRAFIPKAFKP
jgi:hypothetical protein